jgi:uncharacterized protein
MTDLSPLPRQRIAVIGAGIAGMGAAWALSRRHDVTLFEREPRPGGHSNTVEADDVAVDTGFIVYNARNYPNLVRLFDRLGVPTENSDMSFAVSVGDGALEWSGTNLLTLFGQPRNLLSPRFHRMWRDILRFNKQATAALESGALEGLTLGDYLAAGRYSEQFRLDYLLPMGAAIWSAPMAEMLAFPARTFVRFFVNHGLVTVNDRPQWRTVTGGSREYVRRLLADYRGTLRLGAAVRAVKREADGVLVDGERFDQAVIAAHGDQALSMLADADPAERNVLGRFRFQANRAVLHRDESLMPRRRRVWSSWNYLSEPRRDMQRRVGLTYWMNKLQNLDPAKPLFVTMNPLREPAPETVYASFDYEHPLFDTGAIAAQGELVRIQGVRRTWFCGAWAGYGFHEDGLKAGLGVARALGCAELVA